MTPAIGAGTIVRMCSAATPMSAHTPGGSDANLANLTEYFNSAGLSTSVNAVDVTKLDAGTAQLWAREFISGLRTTTSSGNFGDNVQGTFFRLLMAISNGVAHVDGRGKVDMQLQIGGAATGNMRIDFTAIFTSMDFAGEVETPLGGSYAIQVDGLLRVGAQA